ncbi:hypothetical protein MCOR02_007730 [Pyricularia oryzae]|nr:hypothetical protein MCOR02_007730 [Pyricularia oryzae]KAI6321759.1 hypothetical protein MCOR34_002528 [Pyricularia oryzae]KAI6464058.1 hypothetical protein MCOR17_005477 [Pyricularia oryzae]
MEITPSHHIQGLLGCLNEILDSLLSVCSRSDIAALALINNRLNYVSTRQIYTNVHPPLTLFSHTILSCPHLAKHVQRPELAGDGKFFTTDYFDVHLRLTTRWVGEESALNMAFDFVANLEIIVDAFTPVCDTLRFPRNARTLIVAGDLTLYETEELWYDSGEEGPEHDRWNEMFLYCNLRQQFYQWRNATPHFRSLEVTHHPKGNDMDGNSKPILEQLCDEERVLVSLTMEASPLVSGPSD